MKVQYLGRNKNVTLSNPVMSKAYTAKDGILDMAPRDLKLLLATGDNRRLFKAIEEPKMEELNEDAKAELKAAEEKKAADEKKAAEEKVAAEKKAADEKAAADAKKSGEK